MLQSARCSFPRPKRREYQVYFYSVLTCSRLGALRAKGVVVGVRVSSIVRKEVLIDGICLDVQEGCFESEAKVHLKSG